MNVSRVTARTRSDPSSRSSLLEQTLVFSILSRHAEQGGPVYARPDPAGVKATLSVGESWPRPLLQSPITPRSLRTQQ
jgi:hypothetical protein